MDFYPTLFGHAEVRVDRRDPRPKAVIEAALLRKQNRRERRRPR